MAKGFIGIALVILVALLPGIEVVEGQSAFIPCHREPFQIASGLLSNPTDEPAVVFEEIIDFGELSFPWSQVVFSAAELPNGGVIKITSLLDGKSQTLDAEQLREWDYRSAFFNGSSLSVQLIAGPHTTGNFIQIQEIFVGDMPISQLQAEEICGSMDNRDTLRPDDQKGVGRLLLKFEGTDGLCPCTGFIINRPRTGIDKCHLSAGHCFLVNCVGGSNTLEYAYLEFNVPLSNDDCSVNHPDSKDQFWVRKGTINAKASGIGNDWAVFRCSPTLGKTTWESQGYAFQLADFIPSSDYVNMIGYGSDGSDQYGAGGGNNNCTCNPDNSTGTWNYVQQIGEGDLTDNSPIKHKVDTCPGNSGSPIYLVFPPQTSYVIGIHTHAGCVSDGVNYGTPIDQQDLEEALATATYVGLSLFCATGHDGYIEVNWTTATEIDNDGFNLHRGLGKDDPYAHLNTELIPTQGDELQGASYSFTDEDVTNGVAYYYWLEDVDLHGRSTMHGPVSATPTSVEEREGAPIPTVYSLSQNYPNPFNPVTEIKYDLPENCYVTLTIYNVFGVHVVTLVDEHQKMGSKVASWNGRDANGLEVSSGIYFYRLVAGDLVQTRKMVLLK